MYELHKCWIYGKAIALVCIKLQSASLKFGRVCDYEYEMNVLLLIPLFASEMKSSNTRSLMLHQRPPVAEQLITLHETKMFWTNTFKNFALTNFDFLYLVFI